MYNKIKNAKRKLLPFLFGALIITVPVLFFLFKKPAETVEAWWDDTWLYRKRVVFGNSGSAVSAERKVKIDVDTATLISDGKMQASCNDVRFTDVNGTLLDFFIDTATADCNNASTDFYIKVPEVIAGNQTVYMYYGNPGANNARKNDFFADGTLGEGLVGYWPLDENVSGAGETIKDYAQMNDGTTNDSNASGMDCTVEGRLGNYACDFDGSDDYIDMDSPSEEQFSNTDAFSISLWASWDSEGNNLECPFSYGDVAGSSPTSGDEGYYAAFDSGTVVVEGIFFDYYDGSAASGIKTSENTISRDTWHHIVVTQDESNSHTGKTIWVDGVMYNTARVTNTPDGIDYSSSNLNIGARDAKANFDGKIDDVRIYGKELSDTEISRLYNDGDGQAINVPLTFSPTSGPTAASEEQSPGPVAYWSFDEGYGTTAQDSTANNNDGTLTNGPTWQSEDMCISGKCLYFDGSDDYVEAAENANLDVNHFTASLWVKPQSSSGYILTKGDEALTNNTYRVYIPEAGSLTADIWPPSRKYATVPVATGSWSHIALAFDGSTMRIYINGNQVAWDNVSGTLNTNNDPVTMGVRYYNGATQNYFKGFIDEVKIYPYARSAAEIKQDYQRGATSHGAAAVLGTSDMDYLNDGLVVYWKMDEASANTCTGGSNDSCDSSGNGNDGTWVNDTTSISGKFGNGTDYDGTNDYIDTNLPSTTLGAGDYSISMWFKADITSGNRNLFNDWSGSRSVLTRITNNTLGHNVADGSSTLTGANSVPFTDTSNWHHVVFTHRTISNTLRTYLDGDLSDEDTYSGTRGTSTNDFYIGTSPVLSDDYQGSVDEVRIYNRALSPTEVRDLYSWAPGPVAHWKMDEGSWTNDCSTDTVFDSSGNGNDGDACPNSTGPTGGVAGRFGNAGYFDGVDDYIKIGMGELIAQDTITISAWIKPTVYHSQAMIYMQNDEDIGHMTHAFQLRIDGSLAYDNWSPSGGLVASNDTVPLNQWTHVSLVRNDDDVTFYINGIGSGGGTGDARASSADIDYTLIGGRYRLGAPEMVFEGYIDDVRIYNYARSQQQIIQDMNAGHPAPGSPVGSPVMHLKFDEGYGDTANDSSPQGNNGDIGGSADTCPGEAQCPSIVSEGKIGRALDFDGNNDRVIVTDSDSMDLKGALTLSAWIYPKNTDSDSDAIIGKQLSSWTSPYYVYNITRDASEQQYKLCVSFTDDSRECVRTTSTITTDNWYHLTGTFDGSNLKMYLNGTLEATETADPTKTMRENNENINIGRTQSNRNYFQGMIDEVKAYNFALTEDQVRAEYNFGKSQVLGATGTDSSNNATWSADNEYCPPGQGSTCTPPVAEWSFDDGAGTSAQDSSGNGNTGTLTNGPTWVHGKYGKAVGFDGSNDVVTVSSDSSWQFTNSVTVSTWAYFDDFSSNQIGIMKAGSSPGGTNTNYYWRYTGGTTLQIRHNDLSESDTQIATSLSTNQWHYVAWTYNGSIIKMYADGILVGSNEVTGSFNLSSLNLYLGAGYSSDNELDGKLDNVRIYDYARTPAQIAWEYNQGAPVAYWDLDECQGLTAHDASGNGNDGTITIGGSGDNQSAGTCSSGTGTEAWNNGTSGKINASLDFDGEDDYFDSNVNVEGLEELSVSAWINLDNTGDGYDTIMSNYTGGGEMSLELRKGSNDDNYIDFIVENSSNSKAYATYEHDPPSGWVHLVGTYDGSAVKLFINSKEVDSEPQAGPTDSSSNLLTIGDNPSVSDREFDGQIDEVKIFNYALTEQQVQTLYNEGAVSFGY
jgi:hypothetical protein